MKICGIYKITSPSKSIYIGQSIDITFRWYKYKKNHCKTQNKLNNSFKKYGAENHLFEIVCQCDRSELNNLEVYYIELFQTFNSKHGLNLRSGGEGKGNMSEETKKKISEIQKGKRVGKDHHFFGKKHSIETKNKISASRIGIKHSKHISEESRLNYIAAAKKRKHSDITKKKISDYVKANPVSFWKGKKRSQETIDKIKLTKSLKKSNS